MTSKNSEFYGYCFAICAVFFYILFKIVGFKPFSWCAIIDAALSIALLLFSRYIARKEEEEKERFKQFEAYKKQVKENYDRRKSDSHPENEESKDKTDP